MMQRPTSAGRAVVACAGGRRGMPGRKIVDNRMIVTIARRAALQRLVPIALVDPEVAEAVDVVAAACDTARTSWLDVSEPTRHLGGFDVLVVQHDRLDRIDAARAHSFDGGVLCLGPPSVAILEGAFRAGVDDYARVPVAREELGWRIASLARRAMSPGTVALGELRLDTAKSLLFAGGDLVARLAHQEAAVLARIARDPGALVSVPELLDGAPGQRLTSRNHLHVLIRQLRRRLGRHGVFIRTSRSDGYLLEIAEERPRREPRPEERSRGGARVRIAPEARTGRAVSKRRSVGGDLCGAFPNTRRT